LRMVGDTTSMIVPFEFIVVVFLDRLIYV
jgi:hypothetical protein